MFAILILTCFRLVFSVRNVSSVLKAADARWIREQERRGVAGDQVHAGPVLDKMYGMLILLILSEMSSLNTSVQNDKSRQD